MSLSATTQKVIKLVEEKTGLPVATLVSVKVARGTTPLHSVNLPAQCQHRAGPTLNSGTCQSDASQFQCACPSLANQ